MRKIIATKMLGEITNLKKVKRIYKKIFDEQLIKELNKFDNVRDYFFDLKSKVFNDIPSELRVLWVTAEIVFNVRLNMPIMKQIDFYSMGLVYALLMEQLMLFEDVDFEEQFLNDFEDAVISVLNSSDENGIKELIIKYKDIIDIHFKENDEFDLYDKVKETEPIVNAKIELLKKRIDDNEYEFIEAVHYLSLKNILILHIVLRSYLKRIQPFIKSMIEYEKGRVRKITDTKLLKVIKESNLPGIQSALILEKNNVVPLKFTEIFNESQDDLLKIIQYNFKMLEFVNTDIVLIYLKNCFNLKKMNKEKLAEILYLFMDILFEYDSDIEILSKEEWRNQQERKGYTPGENNRAWRTYMIRQVEKHIPFFDDWVNNA